MIEAMLTNTMLVLGVALLMLVINYRFRKYSRLLLWTEGIASIVGTMLGIGLGWIRLFLPDGYPNFPVVVAVTIVIGAGAIFIICAERLHKKTMALQSVQSKESEPENVPKEEETSAECEEVVMLPLKGKLDTPLAAIIFKKALESGLMSIEQINGYRQFYHWKGSKVLLSYMCGRTYCGDTPEKVPMSNDVVWKAGKGKFPSTDLGRLFNENNLGQQRANRLDEAVPTDYERRSVHAVTATVGTPSAAEGAAPSLTART